MKTKIIYLILFLASISAFANDPLSVSISGPHKIFTNDQVTYTATVVGASPSLCVWTTQVGAWHYNNGTFYFDAPSIPMLVTIYCSVTVGEGDDEVTAEDSITVSVVEPQIILCRDSLDLDGQYSLNGPNITNFTSDTTVAFIHRNGMKLPAEALMLSIIIAPTDVDIQSFELTTSNTSSLHLYKNNSKLNLPYHPSSISKVSALNTDLNGLRVWGNKCGTGLDVNLEINNNQKISLTYNVYGIGNNAFTFPSLEQASIFKDDYPNLVNNEWAYENDPDRELYNCLAYAIKKPSKVNNKYFYCLPALGNNVNYDYANKFVYIPECDSYVTSVDSFGNKNGACEDNDIDAYFMNSFWGQDKATTVVNVPPTSNSIPHGDMFYYDGFHAARKSARNEGAYTSWYLLESKCGDGSTLIHRLKQLSGGDFGNITKVYYK